jgi:NAD(P)-dependent dehydrogenase (short-subunit alcohol dehydrogenase family)
MSTDGVLAGRVAIVTGGGSGLGRASSEALAKAGASVVIGDVNMDGANETVAAITANGGRAVAQTCDVSRAPDCEALVKRAVDEYGGLHILHNNAGVALVGRDGFAPNVTPEDWDLVIAINLSGTFYCCHYAVPAMTAGGSIINTASSMAHLPLGAVDGYAASKHGVAGLTKSMAPSCAALGIRVNAISPGYVDTPMNAMIFGVPDIKDAFELGHAGGLQDPDEIADLIVFLASDASRSFNGAVLNCDRGWTSFKMPDALRQMMQS